MKDITLVELVCSFCFFKFDFYIEVCCLLLVACKIICKKNFNLKEISIYCTNAINPSNFFSQLFSYWDEYIF